MFETARPRYALPLAGKVYELMGTFGMIEAVEYAMKDYVGNVALNVMRDMGMADLAKLLSAILTACDHKTTQAEAGQMIWQHVGATGEENDMLRFHLYAFICICIAPPAQREKRAEEMGELLGKFTASRGDSTDKSA